MFENLLETSRSFAETCGFLKNFRSGIKNLSQVLGCLLKFSELTENFTKTAMLCLLVQSFENV